MVNQQFVLAALRAFYEGAYEKLEELANAEPTATAEAIKAELLSDDNGLSLDYSPYLLTLMVRAIGAGNVADWIRANWAVSTPVTRSKICYWAHADDGMPTDLVMELFAHPNSTVRERHLLFAGLALTASTRHMEATLWDLIPKLGKYDDAKQQEALDELVSAVIRGHHIARKKQ